jgi:predicted transcriptional regulator
MTSAESYVIVKLTALGRMINSIDKFKIGDQVYCVARMQSYKIKNREVIKRDYIHDSIIYSIAKVERPSEKKVFKKADKKVEKSVDTDDDTK